MIIHVVLLSLFTLFLIVEDLRWFEINFGALAVVVFNGVCLNLMFGVSVVAMLGGGLAWMCSAVLVRFLFGSKALGQGDIWLMGSMGLLAGVGGSLVAIMIYGLLMLITAYSYRQARSRAKGRRIISLFPAALPGGLTLLLVICGRMGGLDLGLGMAADVMTSFDAALREAVVVFGKPAALASAVLGFAWILFDRKSLDSERSA